MSLLNEALRKKSRQDRENAKINLLKPRRAKRKGIRRGVFFFIFTLLLCIGTVALWYLITSQKKLPAHRISGLRMPIQLAQKKSVSEDMIKTKGKEANPQNKSQNDKKPENKVAIKKMVSLKPSKKSQDKKIMDNEKVRTSQKKIGKKKTKKPLSKHENGIEKIFLKKAMNYHQRNDLDKAIKMYKEVLKKNPDNYDALYNLSSIYLRTSNYSDAYLLLKRLKQRKDPRLLINMAVAEIGMGKPKRAIKHLEEAERLNDAPLFEIYLHHGIALSHLKQLDDAIAYYRKAEELNPNDSVLLFNMAVALDKKKRYDKALEYYIKFLNNTGDFLSSDIENVKKRIYVLKRYINLSNNP